MFKDLKDVVFQSNSCNVAQLSVRFLISKEESLPYDKARKVAIKIYDLCVESGTPERLPFMRVAGETPDWWFFPFSFCPWMESDAMVDGTDIFGVTLNKGNAGEFNPEEMVAFRNFVLGIMLAVEMEMGGTVEFHDMQHYREYLSSVTQTVSLSTYN